MDKEDIIEKIKQDPESWLTSVERQRKTNTIVTFAELIVVFAVAIWVVSSVWGSFDPETNYSKSQVDQMLKDQRQDFVLRLQHVQQCLRNDEAFRDKQNLPDCIKLNFAEDVQ